MNIADILNILLGIEQTFKFCHKIKVENDYYWYVTSPLMKN